MCALPSLAVIFAAKPVRVAQRGSPPGYGCLRHFLSTLVAGAMLRSLHAEATSASGDRSSSRSSVARRGDRAHRWRCDARWMQHPSDADEITIVAPIRRCKSHRCRSLRRSAARRLVPRRTASPCLRASVDSQARPIRLDPTLADRASNASALLDVAQAHGVGLILLGHRHRSIRPTSASPSEAFPWRAGVQFPTLGRTPAAVADLGVRGHRAGKPRMAGGISALLERAKPRSRRKRGGSGTIKVLEGKALLACHGQCSADIVTLIGPGAGARPPSSAERTPGRCRG